MTFKEIFERYRNNTASSEDRILVEEELEKHRLITEYLDEDWDVSPALTDTSPLQDMKKIRKKMRQRNVLIVLTSIVLCMAILLTSWFAIIPVLEKQYWNPEANTSGLEYSDDLEALLSVYAELLSHETSITDVYSTKTGFATYDLRIQYYTGHTGKNLFTNATLEKGKLKLPDNLLSNVSVNIFTRASYPIYNEYDVSPTLDELAELPEYITIKAAVSFKNDMDMTELLDFSNNLYNGYIGWVGVRNSPNDIQLYPLCGFKLHHFGLVLDMTNDSYPDLYLPFEKTPVNMENHFKSMLRFLDDQYNSGTGIELHSSQSNNSYYKEVLDYVEANGVYSYGCYITGSPKTFIELLNNEAIEQIWIQDSWLNIR